MILNGLQFTNNRIIFTPWKYLVYLLIYEDDSLIKNFGLQKLNNTEFTSEILYGSIQIN